MSLKILILPTFIILELILAIGYIKPDIDALLTKRGEIEAAKADLAKVDTVVENISSLSQSLTSHADTVSFVKRYYPSILDEERVVDMFNFLAQQSGIIVTDVKIIKNPVPRSSDAAYTEALNSGLTNEQALSIAEAAALMNPQSYTATVAVLGAYPNIKDFFNRVYHSDRIHEIESYTISERKKDVVSTEAATKGIQDNFLVGIFTAKFPFVVKQRASDPLNNALYQTPNFNYDVADQTLSFVTNPLPPLDSGLAGRPNPFE